MTSQLLHFCPLGQENIYDDGSKELYLHIVELNSMNDADALPHPGDEQRESFEPAGQKAEERQLVRLLKPVVFTSEVGKSIDERTVAPQFYNCFNYSLLSKDQNSFNLTVGITSANPGEGKTLVAANLAVSLAISNQRETLLVDLNIRNPRLHAIFGTKLSPGFVESLGENTIQVVPTRVKHLYVLPAGNPIANPQVAGRVSSANDTQKGAPQKVSFGLEQLAAFRDVLYSLRQTFEFVIIDMPTIQEPRMPNQLMHLMDGVLVVVDANRTKHQDVERTFNKINRSKILGFVMNRASQDNSH
jgi:protein-tyrosine kinase